MLRFQCPHCKGIVAIDDNGFGAKVACAHCGEKLVAPKSRLEPGAIIGDFLIIRELGAGGMGIVYLAHQLSLDRLAAIKVLNPEYSRESDSVAAFIHEARSAAKINHPNIVQAYAVGVDEKIFYFAMEYIDGQTMKQVLAERGKIAPDEAAAMIMQVADGLDCAWKEQRLVHHDIKPDNMMLCRNNRVKLADLGLAKKFGEDANDDSEEVLGTPQYISPEQLTGAVTDTRSDIYSLGATFYHLVTGRFPFIGDTTEEIAKQHVYGKLTPPRVFEASLPEALNRIIVKMMAKDPDDRYPNCEELVNELRRYLAQRGAGNFGTTSSGPIPLVDGLATTTTGGLSRLATATGDMPLLNSTTTGNMVIQPPSGVKISIVRKTIEPPAPVAENPGDNATDTGGNAKLTASAGPIVVAPPPDAAAEESEPEKNVAPPEGAEAVVAALTERVDAEDRPAKKHRLRQVWILIALLVAAGVAVLIYTGKKRSAKTPVARPAPVTPVVRRPAVVKPPPPPPTPTYTYQAPELPPPPPPPPSAVPVGIMGKLDEVLALRNGDRKAFAAAAERFLSTRPAAVGLAEAQKLEELRSAYVDADESAIVAPRRRELLQLYSKALQEANARRIRQEQQRREAEQDAQLRTEALKSPAAYTRYLEGRMAKLDFYYGDAALDGKKGDFAAELAAARKEPELVSDKPAAFGAVAREFALYAAALDELYENGKFINDIMTRGNAKLKNLEIQHFPGHRATISAVGKGVITAVEMVTPPLPPPPKVKPGAKPPKPPAPPKPKAVKHQLVPEKMEVPYARLVFEDLDRAFDKRGLYFAYMLYNKHFDVDFRPAAPNRFWADRVPTLVYNYFYGRLERGNDAERAKLKQQYGSIGLFNMALQAFEKNQPVK